MDNSSIFNFLGLLPYGLNIYLSILGTSLFNLNYNYIKICLFVNMFFLNLPRHSRWTTKYRGSRSERTAPPTTICISFHTQTPFDLIISCSKKVSKSVIAIEPFLFLRDFWKGLFIFCGIFGTHPAPAADAISPTAPHQIRPENPERKKPRKPWKYKKNAWLNLLNIVEYL